MMRYRSCLAIACALSFSAQPALAQDAISPAKLAAASALVEKLELERALDGMFNNLKGLFAQNVTATLSRGEDGERLFQSLPGGRERFETVLGDEFVASLRKLYPDFKQRAAREYATLFTEEDLRALNQFFSSGPGEKWRQMSPQLEKAMSAWGETAGMKAGTEALTNTLAKVEAESKQGTPK